MKRHEAFPSKYLSAPDIPGPVNVRISHVETALLESRDGSTQEKACVYFEGKKKGLVLNNINWTTIEEITGKDDSDDWAGYWITLYPTKTQFGKDVVPCIRIRESKAIVQKPDAPRRPPAPPDPEPEPEPEDIPDDNIPF